MCVRPHVPEELLVCIVGSDHVVPLEMKENSSEIGLENVLRALVALEYCNKTLLQSERLFPPCT